MGFWLKLAWLWQDPLPRVDRIIQAIVGPAYLRDMEAQRKDLEASTVH